jgi:hypothetical protein
MLTEQKVLICSHCLRKGTPEQPVSMHDDGKGGKIAVHDDRVFCWQVWDQVHHYTAGRKN